MAIPAPLIEAAARQQLIPFIGAGMSASLGLPRWHELLARVAESLPSNIPYKDLATFCDDDPLRIAEYLFLVAGREIGPIRHRISQALAGVGDATQSSGHIELVNLGARRIYTTNYDDIIERVLADLGEPVQTIATPRHVAQFDGRAVEVVKYHGDLQWENTLVLTESSYYDRLSFESPLDIKFRSDLLGNSVLFLGYGLGDLNIRVIWHRLMAMMRGVDPEERPRSFIVRLERNAAREALDEAVGITTIALDDPGLEPDHRIASFLLELSYLAQPSSGPAGSGKPMHMSSAFLQVLARTLDAGTADEETLAADPFTTEDLIDQSARRRIPSSLKARVEEIVGIAQAASSLFAGTLLDALLPNYAAHFVADAAATDSADANTGEK